MAEEYKSSKTKQVMNLINAKPSGVNPFLPPAEQEKEKKARTETTVEDKLLKYTQSNEALPRRNSRTRPGITLCCTFRKNGKSYRRRRIKRP